MEANHKVSEIELRKYRVVWKQLLKVWLHTPHGVLNHAHVHLGEKEKMYTLVFFFATIPSICIAFVFWHLQSITELEVSHMKGFSSG